ncbi:MAG TPA: ATP-binding protein [Buttiauxella sp.]|jgi:hypothetical protein
MYLSSFALTEPEEMFYPYGPSWLNAWESHLYNRALKSTGARGWAFKRFGTATENYAGEMIRNPQYMKYLDAMEQVADVALLGLPTRQRVQILRSRTAFIYIDSWGESGLFENMSSALHTATIDTLPKNLVKKFSVKELTCKIRGEKQSLLQAMRVAQDYLSWDAFDFVVICGGYRAIPLLTFSDEDIPLKRRARRAAKTLDINLSVERTGCFIFSQQAGGVQVNCGHYVIPDEKEPAQSRLLAEVLEPDLVSFASLRKDGLLTAGRAAARNIDLVELYGGSGCLTPALSWEYIKQHSLSQGCMRTILPDGMGGYNFFDTQY